MTTSPPNSENVRGSVDTWLAAAYEILIESGVDAVRVLPLAKKVKLARTSFYWYFEDREALLTALIEMWKVKNTNNLIAQTQAYAESITEAILNVFDCWLNASIFDSQLEFAMRSWALQSEEVARHIAEADALRVQALGGMFERFGYSAHTAATRGRVIYLAQIGYIGMKTVESIEERLAHVPEYLKMFTGVEPEARDLERFLRRNGFSLLSIPDYESSLQPDGIPPQAPAA
ncbi:transcriptional regulator, TetR family [Pseudomonas sp. NFACC02]|uniref:TetR/AcrR family transcriptional regulator n=1 Tax=Pseudomonas TaxID=286 RepID=UPI0008C5BEAA|nr:MULTISPECIES: TetR/AcrR family transcriptional regulator [Pseudomonas]SEQ91914.1 transcriptional regulator, TetR family [Pseudomonas sp. NFACC02]